MLAKRIREGAVLVVTTSLSDYIKEVATHPLQMLILPRVAINFTSQEQRIGQRFDLGRWLKNFMHVILMGVGVNLFQI